MQVKTLSVSLGIASLVLTCSAAAGSLEPPGPPGPTMKTLVELEPRTPIHAADLPLTIGTPGSYYLAEMASFSGAGITIGANDVSIDLNGLALYAAIGATGVSNIALKNGTVAGLALDGASTVKIDNLTVQSGAGAIFMGNRANVHRLVVDGATIVFFGNQCVVSDSQIITSSGMSLGSQSILINVVVEGHDIGVGSNCLISHCVFFAYEIPLSGGDNVEIVDSSLAGAGDAGVRLGTAARVLRSHISGGHVESLTLGEGSLVDGLVAENAQGGVALGDGSQITNSMVSGAVGSAIRVGSNSSVIANICRTNGGAITVTGSGNRVDGNLIVGNMTGIKVSGSGNVIIRNTAHDNLAANYDIAPGNDLGPIGSAATSTSPWANVEY